MGVKVWGNSCGLLNPASQFSTETLSSVITVIQRRLDWRVVYRSNNSTLTPVRDKKVESLMGPSGISQYISSYAHK